MAGEPLSGEMGAAREGARPEQVRVARLSVIAVVLSVDMSRAVVSHRAATRLRSPALAANALHFASDFAGTFAVLTGLLLARAGVPEGDPAAAMVVAVLVVYAAQRLMRENVQVLMDHEPEGAVAAVSAAIAEAEPRGSGGFGYDPIFVPDDDHSDRTMAELAPIEKDAISHRGRASRELLAWLASR